MTTFCGPITLVVIIVICMQPSWKVDQQKYWQTFALRKKIGQKYVMLFSYFSIWIESKPISVSQSQFQVILKIYSISNRSLYYYSRSQKFKYIAVLGNISQVKKAYSHSSRKELIPLVKISVNWWQNSVHEKLNPNKNLSSREVSNLIK